MSALAVGAGDGVGAGVGLRVGDGFGDGVGEGVGAGVGLTVGAGVGDGLGAVPPVSVGDGLGDVVGDGAGGGVGVRVGVGAGGGVRAGDGVGAGVAGDVGDVVAVGIGDGVASDTAVTENVAVASTIVAAAARFLDGCASMAAIEWMPGVARFGTFTSTVKLPCESTVAEGMPLDLPSHWSCTFERTAKAVPLTEIVLPAGPDAGEVVIVGAVGRAESAGTGAAASNAAHATIVHTRGFRVGRRLGTLDR